jgi:hypothetical protein
MTNKSKTVRRKHICLGCQGRRALFNYRGVVKANRDHTLCFACFRNLRNSVRVGFYSELL